MIWKWSCACITICCFLSVTSFLEAEENPSAKQDLSTLSQDKSSSSLFKFEKKDQDSLLQFKGTATDRKQTGEEKGSFGLEALYGHFFLPVEEVYSGYYFFAGKLESDNRQRFNATLAYFLPSIGGEAKFTYRLLHAEIIDNLPLSGEFEEGALEQGLGLSYRKHLKIVLKELGFKYAYTHLGGESIESGPFDLDTPTSWSRVRISSGFGDVDTHEALIDFAAGKDAIDNPVLQGIRLDLGGGYQHVSYGVFQGIDEVTDEGLTGAAGLKACTPFGVLKGMYQDAQAAKTAYGGIQLGGFDVFYKNIDYQYGQDEEVFGIAFTLDLFDIGAAFDRGCRPFFNPSDTGYSSVYQMEHINGLASDEFVAKPKVYEVPDDIYRIDKANLPDNVGVSVSESGEPSLVVTTRCPQNGLRSVAPAGATGAVDVNGNSITLNIADLPATHRAIVVRTNDSCCGYENAVNGYTEVTMMVHTGSFVVDSVVVNEGRGCQIIEPAPEPESEPECGQNLSVGEGCTRDCQCAAGSTCYFPRGSNTGYCNSGLPTGLNNPVPDYGTSTDIIIGWTCSACDYDFQCDSNNCARAGSAPPVTSQECSGLNRDRYCLSP